MKGLEDLNRGEEVFMHDLTNVNADYMFLF